MNIMVFDIPADQGGALSILIDFYKEAAASKNEQIHWFFIVGTPLLQNTRNITVLRYPWTKKSWFNRMFFDYVIAPRLVKTYKIDKVFSLQNVTIPFVKSPQILYVHQPLPFTSYRYSFKENKYFWTYQTIIGKKIKGSISKASQIIVQTEWMKEAISAFNPSVKNNIKVIAPLIEIKVQDTFQPIDSSFHTFFFPGGDLTYKNHRVIVEAAMLLKKRGITDYIIQFTLDPDCDYALDLKKMIGHVNLPVIFSGKLSRETVYKLYTTSVLIFPSYIETFGLPMLEARLHKGVIIASDLSFSREILEDYENASFFDPFNPVELADKMQSIMQDKSHCYRKVMPEKNSFKSEKNLAETVIA